MEETLTYSEEQRQIKEKVAKPMLWLGMISMVMIVVDTNAEAARSNRISSIRSISSSRRCYVIINIRTATSSMIILHGVIDKIRFVERKLVPRISRYNLILSYSVTQFQYLLQRFQLYLRIIFGHLPEDLPEALRVFSGILTLL